MPKLYHRYQMSEKPGQLKIDEYQLRCSLGKVSGDVSINTDADFGTYPQNIPGKLQYSHIVCKSDNNILY